MANLFTYLSNWKLKYICTLVVLLCLGVGNVWGATYTYRLVISKASLKDGGKYVLLVNNRTTAYNNSVSSGHLQTAKTFSSSATTAGSAVTTTNAADQIIYVTLVKKSGDTYYILDSGGKYITASKAASGGMARSDADTYGWTFYGTSGLDAIYEKAYSSKYASFRCYNNGSFRSYTAASHTSASTSGATFYLASGCSVTYDGNGSTSGTVPKDAYLYGEGHTVTVKSNSGTLAKTGYTFAGWNTKADGAGTHYAAGGTFTISANTTLYAEWESAASCSANPTIGTASLNGSFNMTSTTSSIGVSSGTCSTGNAACDWTDYGFVWSDGANTTTPTVGGTNCNKVQVGTTGSGTSWTGSITPSGSTTPTSWTTGHTYYVRTYGKNSKAGAAFVEGSAWSFTPYMVTFNKNDGGATTSTQYVQGGVSTPLTSNSFSRTGYTFNGWNTDADGTSGTGYTNGQSVNLSANLTLYAKWSAKQCTISFDIEGGTGTITNVTATYGQAMPSKESNLPTKTGYNFGGFWDGDGGTGTQYYNADGTSKINWNKDVTATQTLYAKWTIKNYSVTWKVNGEDYTAGTPTDNVNHGSHVTDLPTAPSTASYCGDKFMGWTDATDGAYVHGTSNLYTKASEFPNATGNQVFYAVFADYVAP